MLHLDSMPLHTVRDHLSCLHEYASSRLHVSAHCAGSLCFCIRMLHLDSMSLHTALDYLNSHFFQKISVECDVDGLSRTLDKIIRHLVASGASQDI